MEGKFGRFGHLLVLGSDPNSTFNLLLGQIVLTLWELVDSLNLIYVPRNASFPSSGRTWCLLDFVPKKVSPSGTLFRFPLLWLFSDDSLCFEKLRTLIKLY